MNLLTLEKAAAHEADTLEKMVPAHMLALILEKCMEAGFEARSDVLHHLNNAAVAPIAKEDAFTISRLARRTDEIAGNLLSLLDGDPREGLYTVSMFVMTLIDEGLWSEVRNQAVLVSLLLLEDVKDDRKDQKGQGAVWACDETRWKRTAKDMVFRANLQGLFLAKKIKCN